MFVVVNRDYGDLIAPVEQQHLRLYLVDTFPSLIIFI